MIKDYLTWPWIVTVPLLLCGFGCSVFFIGTDSPLLAPAVFCLLSYVALSLYPNFHDGWEIPKTGSFIMIMLFWLYLYISSLWSTIPYVSTLFTIILSILPCFFAASILAPQPGRWVNIHSGAIWFALGSFAVWALVQFFFLYDTYGPRIHHPMLNPNNLSGLFNLGIFPAIGMFFLSKGQRGMVLTGLTVVIFYAALIVTQSRGGLLACFAGLAVFFPFIVFKNQNGVPWKKLAFLVAIFIAIPYIVNLQHQGALEYNLIGGGGRSGGGADIRTLQDRFYLWESTWNMIKDHFWLGTGLASFYFYYPRYRLPMDRSDGFFAHMDPLQFWAETGILAPVLFYGVLIFILFRTIKAVQLSGSDMRKRLEVVAPFCGMLALTGHTHITFHLYMPGMLLPLSALLAFWYMATERAIGDSGQRIKFVPQGKLKMTTLAVFVFAFCMAAGWTGRISAATYMLQNVQEVAASGKENALDNRMKLIGRVAPPSYGRYFEYEARFRVGTLWAGAKTMKKEDARRLYDEVMYYLDEAEKRNPAFTTIWDLRARTYFAVDDVLLSDGQEQAEALLKKVIEANPLAADSRIGLSNIYKSQGELKKATKILEDGVNWPRQKGRTDITFLISLASLKLQLGDKAAHQMYMNEAQRRAKSYGMIVQKPAAK